MAYAWRMLGNPGTRLTVVRFVLGGNAAKVELLDIPNKSHGILSVLSYNERQKELDDRFVAEFRVRTRDSDMVEYVEVVSNNGEESLGAIKAMDHDCDLYVVGKGDKVITPLTAGLSDWADCPELGPIGDLLVSSDGAIDGSVLVVQQYAGAEMGEGSSVEAKAAPGSNYGISMKLSSVGDSKRELRSYSSQAEWIA